MQIRLAKPTVFRFADDMTLDFFEDELQQAFPCKLLETENVALTYFDTFDWRLYRNNFVLLHNGKRYELRTIADQKIVAAFNSETIVQLGFWREFPSPELQQILRPVLDIRAAQPIFVLQRICKKYALLNKDEKTVLRLQLEYNASPVASGDDQKLCFLHINPVRGYDDELAKLTFWLEKAGLRQIASNFNVIVSQFSLRPPGEYSSKFNLQLSKENSVGETLQIIFRDLLSVIRQNENGVRDDIDTEFLHDFRVAIRRTRSALSQIKGVLSDEDAAYWKKQFSEVGGMTNRLRDLDVYLLKEEDYLALAPESLVAGLKPVFRSLASDRKKEHRKIAEWLNSEKYRAVMREWEAFLDKDDSFTQGARAAKVVQKTASQFIYKKYLKILRNGKRLDARSPDQELHDLRIECKKLRYLLEFFKSLYPEKEISQMIQQLKLLQENLGDFNDLYVQQQDLARLLAKAPENPSDIKVSAAAIGGLIGILYQRQLQVRLNFSKVFARFGRKKSVSMFEKLFAA